MSKYLDRLYQLNDEKFSQHTPDSELTKPPEAPFVSFGGRDTGHIVKNNADETDQSAFQWMWQVIMPDRELTVTTTPKATLAEMWAWYPTAIEISVAAMPSDESMELSDY